jgi:hypothetical protein
MVPLADARLLRRRSAPEFDRTPGTRQKFPTMVFPLATCQPSGGGWARCRQSRVPRHRLRTRSPPESSHHRTRRAVYLFPLSPTLRRALRGRQMDARASLLSHAVPHPCRWRCHGTAQRGRDRIAEPSAFPRRPQTNPRHGYARAVPCEPTPANGTQCRHLQTTPRL